MKFNKFIAAVVGAGAMFAAASANAVVFPDFKVCKSMACAPGVSDFTADKITGNYVEVITFGAGTFDVSLSWVAGQFVANDGQTPLNSTFANGIYGGPTGLGVSYGLYAFFKGSGTFSSSGGVTTFTLAPGGMLDVYRDNYVGGVQTTLNQPASGSMPWTAGPDAGDDKLLATGTSVSGTGTLDPTLPTCSGGINCGSFGQTTTFALNADGMKFFVDPVPFYNLSFQSGQLNNFSPAGTVVINGSLDVVFGQTPEPGSLALVGLALVGLGAAARRRKA